MFVRRRGWCSTIMPGQCAILRRICRGGSRRNVADDGRRSRVASALLDFGARVQESVFVANLEADLAERMVGRLTKLIDVQFDRVHVFELCAACSRRTKVLGAAEVVEDREFYIV